MQSTITEKMVDVHLRSNALCTKMFLKKANGFLLKNGCNAGGRLVYCEGNNTSSQINSSTLAND